MSELFMVQGPAKQPYECIPYTVKTRQFMAKGEEIGGVAARVYVKGDDPEVTYEAAMLYQTAYSNKTGKVQIWATGGTDGITYVIRVRIQCLSGSRYEVEIEFDVEETQ